MAGVSVVVPARDAEPTLDRALAAIVAQDLDEPFEVIVADDGSRDRTAAIARAAGARVVATAGTGAGPARDGGVAAAAGRLIAFTDADCFPAPGWLKAGVAALREADIVQGRVVPDPHATVGPFDRTLWVSREVGLYETANLFVTRAAYDRAGGFEAPVRPVTGKMMGEDVLFGWRARRAGARSAFCAEALVHHAVFARGSLDYVAERRRCEHFPELVAQVPELRDAFFFRRWFLSRRSAEFDAALAGVALALARRSTAPLGLAVPYGRTAWRRARSFGRRRAPAVVAVDLAADAVALTALARGSARTRAPVL